MPYKPEKQREFSKKLDAEKFKKKPSFKKMAKREKKEKPQEFI